MENIQYIIEKMTDSYLLPSVVATLIIFMYFSYKRVGKNFGNKPFAIFNAFYFGENVKNDFKNSPEVTKPSFPVSLFYPMNTSDVILTQLREKKVLHNSLSFPKKNTKKNVIPKHQSTNKVKTENLYMNSAYKMGNNFEEAPSEFIKRNEMYFDWYSMMFRLRSCDKNTFQKKHTLNMEPLKKNINKKAVKNPNTPEITLKDKLKRPFTQYYRLVYDEEDRKNYLGDYCGEIFEKQNEPDHKNVSVEVLKANDSAVNMLDGYESSTVKLNLNNSSKKSQNSDKLLTDIVKDECNTVNYEKYYQIA